MNTDSDQEWALGLFERSRQGEEPMWVADHGAMIRAGKRRNRIRTLAASGSVVATAAVVAAVGVGVSGGVSGPGRKAPGSAPGHSAPPPAVAVDPSKALDYARFISYSPKNPATAGTSSRHYLAVPTATARDTMQLLSKLDPTLAHIARTGPAGTFVRPVADDDPAARDEAMVNAYVSWTESGLSADELLSPSATAPTGTLRLLFMDSSNGGTSEQGACIASSLAVDPMLHPVQNADQGWTDAAAWSGCTTSKLPDGSVVMTASKNYGPFSLLSAIREFPGGNGGVSITWQNFASPTPGPGIGQPSPDPKRALSHDPLSVEKLVAALSDPKLVPPLSPAQAGSTTTAAATPPPPTMLQPSDFGAGWSAGSGTNGKTGDLVVDNGCTNQQNPVASPQTIYGYTGTTPSGIKVTASAQLDVMTSGSGPGWMADLRQHGSGGCDTAGLPYSHDTMTPLPAGTGDDAFIENWYGQSSETFFIRFKDDILRVDVTTADQKMPAFTAADKEWFAGLAAKAAARHDGKG